MWPVKGRLMGTPRWIKPYEARLMRLLTPVVVAYWNRREPAPPLPRRYSEAPSDNVQQTMNLIMPLAHPGPTTTAELKSLLASNLENLFVGLDNVGTVHTARFDVVGNYLCMVSVYDGDFETYIRDFIVAFGDVFTALMAYVKDPPPLPVELHPAAFVEWVDARDLLQLPDDPTEITDDLDLLPRRLVLLLKQQPNVQLGAYRAYAGFSVAQIRQALRLEWEVEE